MKELVWLILVIAAVYGGYSLLKWGFPRMMRYFLKRLIRRQFGIDFDEPKQPRGRRGAHNQPYPPGSSRRPRRRGKKIPRDVGEYVEFEEISSVYECHRADGSGFRAEEQVVDVKWKDLN